MALASDRLRLFLREHPNACADYTLTDIGNAIGVTRERVRQLMPTYSEQRRAAKRAQLERLIAERPELALPKRFGGVSTEELRDIIGGGVSPARIEGWLREMGYPDRSAYFIEGKKLSTRAWAYTVIRTETCEACGKAFPWTKQRDRFYKSGQQKFKVCSHRCGIVMREPRRRTSGRAEQIRALLAENPKLTQTEIADRLGISRERVRQLKNEHNLPIQKKQRRVQHCKKCGMVRPHPGGRVCILPPAELTCVGCGKTFNRSRKQVNLMMRDERFGGKRAFCSRPCMHAWQARNGAEWFVRRKPQDWGFGRKAT